MSLKRLIIFLLALCTPAITISVRAQNSVEDSIELSKAGKNAKTDELYFDALKAILHDDDKQAQALLEQFVALRPEVSDAYYELSKISYTDRKADKAEAYVKKALDLDPNNKWYKEEYASLLADRGAFDEAANIAAALARDEPQNRNYPLVAAEYFEKAKKYQDALDWLDRALVTDNTDEEILRHKVEIYLGMNKVDKAAEVVQKLLVAEPRSGRYYKWLGDIYDSNRMPDKAAEVYKQAQKIIPGDADVEAGVAEHYLRTGDTAAYLVAIRKAIVNGENEVETQMQLLERFIQVLPNDSVRSAQGLAVMRLLLAQHADDPQVALTYGDFQAYNNHADSAALAYKKALAMRPARFEDWEKLLNVYSDRKYADSLIRYSEKAMRLFPSVAMVSYYNGLGHMNKKEYASAINAVKRAIDMQPESNKPLLSGMYSLLADIYHANKQDDLSDKAFDKAIQLDPGNASVMNNYAYYLSERGARLDEAERMSQRSLELRPNEATFLDTYGWIEYKKGNFLKAKDYVERAIKHTGDKADATLYDHLGNICYQLNERSKAVDYWKMAKKKGGDDPLIDKKINEGKLYE